MLACMEVKLQAYLTNLTELASKNIPKRNELESCKQSRISVVLAL